MRRNQDEPNLDDALMARLQPGCLHIQYDKLSGNVTTSGVVRVVQSHQAQSAAVERGRCCNNGRHNAAFVALPNTRAISNASSVHHRSSMQAIARSTSSDTKTILWGRRVRGEIISFRGDLRSRWAVYDQNKCTNKPCYTASASSLTPAALPIPGEA